MILIRRIQEVCQVKYLILKQDILINLYLLYQIGKLRLVNSFSKITQNKIEKLCKRICKIAKVKLVFTRDKLR